MQDNGIPEIESGSSLSSRISALGEEFGGKSRS